MCANFPKPKANPLSRRAMLGANAPKGWGGAIFFFPRVIVTHFVFLVFRRSDNNGMCDLLAEFVARKSYVNHLLSSHLVLLFFLVMIPNLFIALLLVYNSFLHIPYRK